jgi:hypothetical protein
MYFFYSRGSFSIADRIFSVKGTNLQFGDFFAQHTPRLLGLGLYLSLLIENRHTFAAPQLRWAAKIVYETNYKPY